MATAQTLDAPALFQNYIRQSLRYSLDRLQKPGQTPASDRDLALQTLDYALEYAPAWPHTRRLLIQLAPKMEQAGHRQETIHLLEKAIRHSIAHNDTATEAELRLQLGILHQLLAQYPAAAQELTVALQKFTSATDGRGQARALNRLAYVERKQNQYDQAHAHARSALALLAEHDSERAYCHLVFGLIHLDQRLWQQAADSFTQSLEIFYQHPDQRMLAWGHTNLGLALWRLQQHTEAERHLQRAIELFGQIEDPVHAAVAMMNLGNLHMSTHAFAPALASYLQARTIFRKAQDRWRLGIVENNCGMAYRKLNRLEEAEAAYKASIVICADIDHDDMHANAAGGLARVYLQQQRYQAAIAQVAAANALLPAVSQERTRTFLHQAFQDILAEAQAGQSR